MQETDFNSVVESIEMTFANPMVYIVNYQLK